jgi:hypothetical protein
VNDDTPAAECLRIRRVDVVGCPDDIVVDDGAVTELPDLGPELVDSAAAADVAIGRCKQESLAGTAVHIPGAPELGLGTRQDEPLVVGAVEVEASDVALAFRLPVWNVRTLLVFRVETEGRLPDERLIDAIGARRRIDPAAAGNEPGTRVVDHHVLAWEALMEDRTGDDHQLLLVVEAVRKVGPVAAYVPSSDSDRRTAEAEPASGASVVVVRGRRGRALSLVVLILGSRRRAVSSSALTWQ